ncbi:helix-turn-helix domain-containing protein [Planktotalea sp.]|uniref:helix-turn-helix domain-containing protein n=1 Tax=Planktotalea sp. TaxID=2029877 RepID=UPI003D6C05D3
MIQSDLTKTKSLGADLRALRKSRGMTLSELADILERSVGWISQVERDLSEPSVADLKQIAKALGVPVSILFGQAQTPAGEAGVIVRSHARRPIGSKADGLVEELLSPDLTDDFEMVHSTFDPGASMQEAITRETQEVGYLVSGALDLEIDGRAFTVTAGDSFRIKGVSYRWANPYDAPAVAIWVIAPPVY